MNKHDIERVWDEYVDLRRDSVVEFSCGQFVRWTVRALDPVPIQ